MNDVKNLNFKYLKSNNDLTFSNIPRREHSSLTHSYHRYPAKFIPSLATHLLEKYSKTGDLVCDPFGGCGTTLVESKVRGRRSIGIDISPLAVLISKVKITPINPDYLSTKLDEFTDGLAKETKIHPFAYNPSLNFWFPKENIEALGLILTNINGVKERDIQQFLYCAFSNILKDTSYWLMKSIKPTRDMKKIPQDPFIMIEKQLKFMQKKNSEFYNVLSNTSNLKTEAKYYLRDARKTLLSSSSVDYIVTSPPYVTSYEYADLHKLSLFWLKGFEDWIEFKKKFIGTSHRELKYDKSLGSPIAREIVAQLLYNDPKTARTVSSYYRDMYKFLIEAKRILKKGKYISLVIGNTILKDVPILNAEVAYEQMLNLGFNRVDVEKRQTSFQSITPYRDSVSGLFTSKDNPNKRRAYQFEFVISGIK